MQGFSLIELIVSIVIISTLVISIMTLFELSLKIVADNRLRVGAITLAEEKIEIIKNMQYDDVATQGGIPPGNLLQNENLNVNGVSYTVARQIIFIDDPFDGLAPVDLLSTDYKKVNITITWTGKFGTQSISETTNIAPKGIESNAGGGTLSILVFDANGLPVGTADIHVVNNDVAPIIDANYQTDSNGTVLIPGAPASINGYEITASKAGYSTDQTCAINAATTDCINGNPVPVKPHATIIAGSLTEISFAIDVLANMNIRTISQAIPSDWTVNTDSNFLDQDNPSMAVCLNGNYIFTWRDYQQMGNPRIFGQQFDTNQVPLWIPDFAITTSNNQNNPDIAIDENCNIYVTWDDDRNGNQDIYYQKYDSSAPVPVDLWAGSKKINVTHQSADQNFPQVFVNASSTFEYIVWEDNDADAGDIFAQKFDPNGLKIWSSEIQINTDPVGAVQSIPKIQIDHITVDFNEKIYFIWYDNRDGNNNIYGQSYNSDGIQLWASDVLISSESPAADQINPSFVLSKDDNFLYVVWQDNRNGDYDIYMQKFDTAGSSVWANQLKVNSDTGTAIQENSVVAEDNNGDFYIVWQDNRNGNLDIFMQKVDTDGIKLIEFDVRINSNVSGDQENPDILINPDGFLIIVWQDNSDGDYDIEAAVYSADPEIVTNIPNVPITVTGAKKWGDDGGGTDYYKYQQGFITDATGNVSIINIEWDQYTIDATGYTILTSEPAQPVSVNPNTTVNVILNLQ